MYLEPRDAADRRKIALDSLRLVKSAQFSEINKPSEEEVIAAETLYRNALTDELDLRTIIPGVRIAAPNDPQKKEEDIAGETFIIFWNESHFFLIMLYICF